MNPSVSQSAIETLPMLGYPITTFKDAMGTDISIAIALVVANNQSCFTHLKLIVAYQANLVIF
jgi:hypothetical protein